MGWLKILNFGLWPNSRCDKLKLACYRYKLLYVSHMVTTKQKLIINIQKMKRKQYKHSTKESHQTTKKGSKRREKNDGEFQKQLENN